MVKDSASGIRRITWTMYEKLDSVIKTDGAVIKFSYDASGNRISKTANGVQTWYVKDAKGNVMSIYTKSDSISAGKLLQTEVDIYASNGLGISSLVTNVQTTDTSGVVPLNGLGKGKYTNFVRGEKLFELSNHPGNVLATPNS
jgi:YD repeat-containing protein